MKTNASLKDLKKALSLTNKEFKGNVIFNRLEQIGKYVFFTLRVKDSKGPGTKLSIHKYPFDEKETKRRTCSACWHVHGRFFENLFKVNPDAYVISLQRKIDKNQGNWYDWNIGSLYHPVYFSDSCECPE